MLSIATVFAISFVLAQTAFADIPNRFISTDRNSDVFDVNLFPKGRGLKSGWSFGVYDNDWSKGLDLLDKGHRRAKFHVSVTQNGDDWQITVDGGATKGQTLDIGNSKDFSFYFKNGTDYDTKFSIKVLCNSNQYLFDSDKGGKVTGNDLAAVPLSNSAIFLFSGLVGIVAFGSRKKIMK